MEHFGACVIDISIVSKELNKSYPEQRRIIKGYIHKNWKVIKENSYNDKEGFNPDYI